MKNRALTYLLAILLIGAIHPAFSQALPEKEIDALFSEWNNTQVPGGAVAVVQNGEITYSKAFGMASLEYGVINTPATIFNTGSVSKQFTAFGIALLEQQGKLSVDDEVQKYLPEIPYFDHPVTIRHMLNHTSGLRSLHAILGLAGWRGDDRRSNADLMRFMTQQEDLNFRPGDEYLYCNTGFIFMAEIIERITGQRFEDWMQENIFAPLGMDNTFCRRDINEVVPNVATSYQGPDRAGDFSRPADYWAYVGSGNLHSTVLDMVKWMDNFRHHRLGGMEVFERMQERGVLINGDTITYAFGINVDEYRGLNRLQHGGSIGGFRAYLCYFPDQETGVIVLTNFSSSNPGGKALGVADIVLKDYLADRETAGAEAPTLSAGTWSDQDLRTLPGEYLVVGQRSYGNIEKQNGTLRLSLGGLRGELLPGRDGAILLKDTDIRILPGTDGQWMVMNGDRQVSTIQKISVWEPTEAEKAMLIGEYYSPELEFSYQILEEDGLLMFRNIRIGAFPLQAREMDVMYSRNIRLDFTRNRAGEVSGVLLTNGRARNVVFNKQ